MAGQPPRIELSDAQYKNFERFVSFFLRTEWGNDFLNRRERIKRFSEFVGISTATLNFSFEGGTIKNPSFSKKSFGKIYAKFSSYSMSLRADARNEFETKYKADLINWHWEIENRIQQDDFLIFPNSSTDATHFLKAMENSKWDFYLTMEDLQVHGKKTNNYIEFKEVEKEGYLICFMYLNGKMDNPVEGKCFLHTDFRALCLSLCNEDFFEQLVFKVNTDVANASFLVGSIIHLDDSIFELKEFDEVSCNHIVLVKATIPISLLIDKLSPILNWYSREKFFKGNKRNFTNRNDNVSYNGLFNRYLTDVNYSRRMSYILYFNNGSDESPEKVLFLLQYLINGELQACIYKGKEWEWIGYGVPNLEDRYVVFDLKKIIQVGTQIDPLFKGDFLFLILYAPEGFYRLNPFFYGVLNTSDKKYFKKPNKFSTSKSPVLVIREAAFSNYFENRKDSRVFKGMASESEIENKIAENFFKKNTTESILEVDIDNFDKLIEKYYNV